MSKDPLNLPRNVISVGALPELLSLRERVLRSVGYAVFTTTDPQEAMSRIGKADCGVLLLCYPISDEWRKELVRRFHNYCPNGRVVAITNHPVVETPKEEDAVVYGVEGPEILIDAVRGKAA
jgi:DNA-binding NtrC family response regulator